MFHEKVSKSLDKHRIQITVTFRMLGNNLLSVTSTASVSYNVFEFKTNHN